jgi:DnaJ-class molecular chaperone
MRMFFGSCQDVSGNDWWGNPQAPWNQPDAVYENCPDCNGDGGVWYDEDGNKYSVADYERLSEECREGCEFEKCERCDGLGTIEVEPYEPDYDDYDD